jgi:peptide/nickel transport system permease protein
MPFSRYPCEFLDAVGVGRLAVDSIYVRDFPVVQADVFVIAVAFVLINLAVDIVYTWLDPRVALT